MLQQDAVWSRHGQDVTITTKTSEVHPTMSVEIYHNPRCSKSRQTLQLLQEQGVDPDIVEYLKTPPDKKTLEKILDMLGLEPRDLMRKKESEYKEHGLADPALTRKQLIEAMVEHPKLIERPIVIKNGKAAIGRPPEKVLEIL
jgi:arsenate reductase